MIDPISLQNWRYIFIKFLDENILYENCVFWTRIGTASDTTDTDYFESVFLTLILPMPFPGIVVSSSLISWSHPNFLSFTTHQILDISLNLEVSGSLHKYCSGESIPTQLTCAQPVNHHPNQSSSHRKVSNWIEGQVKTCWFHMLPSCTHATCACSQLSFMY